MRCTALTLSAAALSLAVAAVVHAGPPGSWTPVTSANLVNIDQVGLARTADGLHVIWLSKNGNKEDLRHTTILPSGTGGLAHNSAVVAGWSSLSNASIVVTSSGLQAFWAGIRSTSTTDPYSSGTVFTATAGPAGSAWSLAADPAAAPSSAYASDLVAVTVTKDGTPVTAWSGTPGFYVHDGLDKAKPNVKIQAACCAYQASLATDQGSGEVYAAWYSNAAGS